MTYHTTGFDREEVIDLCILINSVERGKGNSDWPPCLGLYKSVVASLTYMRHNRTQAEIGESLGVSQPTVSRAISAITPLIPEAVREFVPAQNACERPESCWARFAVDVFSPYQPDASILKHIQSHC